MFIRSEKAIHQVWQNLEKNSSFLPRVLEATVACYDRDGSMPAMCKILVYNVILVLVYNVILVFM